MSADLVSGAIHYELALRERMQRGSVQLRGMDAESK